MTATFVALPFLLTTGSEMPLTEHWKIYVGALLVSLGIAVPMIMNDQHQGRSRLIGLAVTLVVAASSP